jgi:hypothetical protein
MTRYPEVGAVRRRERPYRGHPRRNRHPEVDPLVADFAVVIGMARTSNGIGARVRRKTRPDHAEQNGA